jgi:hypothetical protein
VALSNDIGMSRRGKSGSIKGCHSYFSAYGVKPGGRLCRWPSVSTPNTACWQLSTFPKRPDHCRATPTDRSPSLGSSPWARLGEAAFVNDQAARRLATQQAVRVLTDLCHHRFVVPWRIADEVLELLRAAAFSHGGHRRERAFLGLCQPVQIAPGHRRAVPRASMKEPAEAAAQGHKCVGDAPAPGSRPEPAPSEGRGQAFAGAGYPPTIRSEIIRTYRHATKCQRHFAPTIPQCQWRPIDSTHDSRVKRKFQAFQPTVPTLPLDEADGDVILSN